MFAYTNCSAPLTEPCAPQPQRKGSRRVRPRPKSGPQFIGHDNAVPWRPKGRVPLGGDLPGVSFWGGRGAWVQSTISESYFGETILITCLAVTSPVIVQCTWPRTRVSGPNLTQTLGASAMEWSMA